MNSQHNPIESVTSRTERTADVKVPGRLSGTHRFGVRGRWRRTWLRKILRKLPRRANLHRYPILRRVSASAAKKPYLWSFKREHVRMSLYTGCIIASMPTLGIQAPLAIGAAFLTRSNVTVMVGTQFITNPLTAAPYYWMTHKVGSTIQDWFGWTQGAAGGIGWGDHANALVLGGVVVGLVVAGIIDGLWRLSAWEIKRLRHHEKSDAHHDLKD